MRSFLEYHRHFEYPSPRFPLILAEIISREKTSLRITVKKVSFPGDPRFLVSSWGAPALLYYGFRQYLQKDILVGMCTEPPIKPGLSRPIGIRTGAKCSDPDSTRRDRAPKRIATEMPGVPRDYPRVPVAYHPEETGLKSAISGIWAPVSLVSWEKTTFAWGAPGWYGAGMV